MTKPAFILICLLLVLPVRLSAESPGHPEYDTDFTKKIGNVLRDVAKVKVGMTRADLLKIFTTEGGISNRKQRTYVYHSCPNIKVNVAFEPVGEEKDLFRENPSDKIIKISQPYLELSIID